MPPSPPPQSGRDELPEEVAGARGHRAFRASLISYKKVSRSTHIAIDTMTTPPQEYERWVQDISEDKISLDRIKLCIYGNTRVGKSALRQSLSRRYIQVPYSGGSFSGAHFSE